VWLHAAKDRVSRRECDQTLSSGISMASEIEDVDQGRRAHPSLREVVGVRSKEVGAWSDCKFCKSP
jgi:hypothetical protein